MPQMDWQLVPSLIFSQPFPQKFSKSEIPRHMDSDIVQIQPTIPTFLNLKNWQQKPIHQKITCTIKDGQSEADLYQWRGTASRERAVVVVGGHGEGKVDIAAIVADDCYMLYVANIGGHPAVATTDFQFRNSDGTTVWDIPEEILKGSGEDAVQYLKKKAYQFMYNQSH